MADEKVRPRLVIDTNVFVSGLISGSRFACPDIEGHSAREGRPFGLQTHIVEEYLRVLDYPQIRKFKKITDEFVADIAAYLVYQTERVELVSNIKLSPDPDDDVFLETAVDGRANWLVTNDKADLLSVAGGGGYSHRFGQRSDNAAEALG